MTDLPVEAAGPGTFDVIDLMTGYQAAAALTAAARLGVCDLLARGPADAARVAAELGTEPLATRALLDALVGLGLLVADGPPDSPTYVGTVASHRLASGGDLRLVAEKEAFFAREWLDLAESVRTGTPRLAPWRERLVTDPVRAREFLRALVVLADETGPDLASLVGRGDQVADLGGGFGAYALPMAVAGAQVDLVDLPTVAGWASAELSTRASARGWGHALHRVTPLSVDLLAPGAFDVLGRGRYDVVLLSHLLHDHDDIDCRRLVAAAADLARPGGRVVVFELPGDPPGAFGPMFDLMMRVETPGRARRRSELAALLSGAGLVDVRVLEQFAAPAGVLEGVRPD
ncbi:MAG: hypothetical protein CMH83_14945 [Nocardioides sp.]|nr:hypothetical protein [Nocardioides sp.]